MKRKKRLFLLFTVCFCFLTACGQSSKSNYNAESNSSVSSSSIAGMTMDMAAETEQAASDTAEAGETETAQNITDGRKLIKEAYLDVETKDFDNMLSSVSEQISSLGGYIEHSSTTGNSYSYDISRSCYLIARIPSEYLDTFISTVGTMGNITNKQENVTDVTLNYIDIESRKKSLETEQERLLTLLEEAGDLESIIALEERLSEVRYEIENYESQIRTYDNQIDYSTVTINISEVSRITSVSDESALDKMANGFKNSFFNVVDGFKNFFIWIVIHLPYLLIWAVIIFIILFICSKIIKHEKKKKAAMKPLPPPNYTGSFHPKRDTPADTQAEDKKQDHL
jgi:hypothetical protein